MMPPLTFVLPRTLCPPPLPTQFAPAGDSVDMFYGDRRTDSFGFIDNITLRVSYDHPTAGRSTVVAVSQCSNPGHTFDWGQNKRNLSQVRSVVGTRGACGRGGKVPTYFWCEVWLCIAYWLAAEGRRALRAFSVKILCCAARRRGRGTEGAVAHSCERPALMRLCARAAARRLPRPRCAPHICVYVWLYAFLCRDGAWHRRGLPSSFSLSHSVCMCVCVSIYVSTCASISSCVACSPHPVYVSVFLFLCVCMNCA